MNFFCIEYKIITNNIKRPYYTYTMESKKLWTDLFSKDLFSGEQHIVKTKLTKLTKLTSNNVIIENYFGLYIVDKIPQSIIKKSKKDAWKK